MARFSPSIAVSIACRSLEGSLSAVSFEAMQRRPDFIASSVFHDRFGEEMLLVLYHPELAEEYRVPSKETEAEPLYGLESQEKKTPRGSWDKPPES